MKVPTIEADDPYLWLEEIRGERALAWVGERTARTHERLMGHPAFEELRRETLRDLSDAEQVPALQLVGDTVYRLYRDEQHLRGVVRRTSYVDLVSGDAAWSDVLDVDALCAAEGESWVFAGIVPLGDGQERGLVQLSPGGADATVLREFDLVTCQFVEDGFVLPQAKQTAVWRDVDRLLVAAASDPEHTTAVGYARTVREWVRGTDLADAEVIFEVAYETTGAQVARVPDGDDEHIFLLEIPQAVRRHPHYLHPDNRVTRLPVTPDMEPALRLADGRVICHLTRDVVAGGETLVAGSLVAFELAPMLATGELPRGEVIVTPDEGRIVNAVFGMGVLVRDGTVYVPVMEHVTSRLLIARREGAAWRTRVADLPADGSINVSIGNDRTPSVIVRYESFTTPPSLYAVDDDGQVEQVWSGPSTLDATGLVTQQFFAVSADGTRVPYFVVGSEDLPTDGTTPAMLTAYGGFGTARQPSYLGFYSSFTGAMFKALMRGGGRYVLANIRGGGEYGPAWHQQGVRERRQTVYDDFHAVAEDLIARGLVGPDRLGMEGASNGGLLAGVAYTQRPELYRAVLCMVPLLDMRRYHLLSAGASWVDEYGDPDDPEMWPHIRAYSPYHNVASDVEYPEVFFVGSAGDDRVHPGHMRKQAALMEQLGKPFLYHENVEGGHYAAADAEQGAVLQALTAVYVLEQLPGLEAARIVPDHDRSSQRVRA